ncbi:MAG TPA: FABP family protein [Ilumatobacteraceae bacterium]|nr:FABP family protein [Ilumatobacteraceae bacterium]
MTPELHPDLHPDVAGLATLLGIWEGRGDGDYPTIEPFSYLESITFAHVGKPFVSYVQRTRHPGTGAPMHAESGYFRVPMPGSIEIVMAQPTGLTEVYEGAVVTGEATLVIDVRSTVIGSTASAKEVTRTERTFSVSGDELHYTFRMAAVGQPLQHHLSATLHRVG